jgi:hypothetical protein
LRVLAKRNCARAEAYEPCPSCDPKHTSFAGSQIVLLQEASQLR